MMVMVYVSRLIYRCYVILYNDLVCERTISVVSIPQRDLLSFSEEWML